MPTQNVNLTAEEMSLIKRLVKSGRYRSASQVLKDGLRLIGSPEIVVAENGEGRHASGQDDAAFAALEAAALRAVILEAKNARERMTPLQPGDVLAWRDEGRA